MTAINVPTTAHPLHVLILDELSDATSNHERECRQANKDRQVLLDALGDLRTVVENIFHNFEDPVDAVDELGQLPSLIQAIAKADFDYTISSRDRSNAIHNVDRLEKLLKAFKANRTT